MTYTLYNRIDSYEPIRSYIENMSAPISGKLGNQPLREISILLVEGDNRMRNLVKNVLTSFGFHTIHVANNGQEAIEKLHANKYDLIITDWKTEPVSGYDLVHYIRNDPNSPDFFVPIIMLSGMAEKRHVEKARDVGITEFVAKPFSVETFRARIISVFENPREFIFSSTYSGPNRRRHKSVRSPSTERRRED